MCKFNKEGQHNSKKQPHQCYKWDHRVFFAYYGAYSIDYWKFDGEKLFNGGEEISFLFQKDEDDFPDDEYDDYEEAVEDYVDKITTEVRDSNYVSEDLIEAINQNRLLEK